MDFNVERTGEQSFHVAGIIDMESSPLFEVALRLALGRGDIAVDMADVSFIDSSGLHSLLRTARSMAGQGLLLIERPSHQVLRLLEVSGVLWAGSGIAVQMANDSAFDGPGAVHVLAAMVDRAVEAMARSTALIGRSAGLIVAAQQLRAASAERRLAWSLS